MRQDLNSILHAFDTMINYQLSQKLKEPRKGEYNQLAIILTTIYNLGFSSFILFLSGIFFVCVGGGGGSVYLCLDLTSLLILFR